jgi:hypothetical protein
LPTPKWLTVARNEYRLQTSGIRGVRRQFPLVAAFLLVAYSVFVAPRLLGVFVDDFISMLLSHVAVGLMQVILFMVFFVFILIPLSRSLQEMSVAPMEAILAAPVRPGDVLMGEFVGKMPLYAIMAGFIAGTFTAVLQPIGLDAAQTMLTIVVFVLTFLSGYWIGVVVTALLRTRLSNSSRGKDLGKALGFVVALPIVGIMYAVIGGDFLPFLADPSKGGAIRAVLSLLPSSWGAEAIVGFARNPGDMGAVAFDTFTRLGALLAFFAATLWIGWRVADRAYSLEPATFNAAVVKPDGAFYGAVRLLGGGGSFGALTASLFKDYSRRFENLSKLFYVVGLYAMLTIFLVKPREVEDLLWMPLMISPLFAAFVAGEATLRGKEVLFIYRKTPSGVSRFLKAKLLQSWMVVVPCIALITLVSMSMIPGATAADMLIYTGQIALSAAGSVAFVLGIFLMNPAFNEKSANFMLNIQPAVFVSIALAIGTRTALRWAFPTWSRSAIDFYSTILQIALMWVLAAATLYLGKRKISGLE